ncbi:MAG: carbohydrate-binding domain-containing protein [Clostridiales bacterium]|nr:carbohydrate-binding domain-containing protein [Clostridiales bacterium]
MKNPLISAAALLLALFLTAASLSGCKDSSSLSSGDATSSGNTEVFSGEDYENSSDTQNYSAQTDSEMFTERDYRTDYDENESVIIRLNGNSASASSDSVNISGTTITITEEATYVISGTLNNGMIIVNAPDTAKLQIVLNGATVASETSAALYVLEADKVFLTLAEGSENFLSNGGSFVAIDDNNIDAVIFSKQDLTINGSGSLTITSPAGHGIVSKNDLVITGGNYNITSASHTLDANDSVRITGDTYFTANAGKDGIHAENNDDDSLGFVYISNGTIKIEAKGDGISSGAYTRIENGTFDITAGGGSVNGEKEASDSWGAFMERTPGRSLSSDTEDDSKTSMKGIKAAADLIISNGTFKIDSADDSVHSNASITVNGGTFEISSGDDAFHADDTLTISSGTINISESYEGLEGLHVQISGGDITIIADDDGVNAAGGTDSSGTTGGRDGMFGRGGWSSTASDGTIEISGGTLYIQAAGDGIDANGSLTVSGGYIVINGPTQGDTSTLDYDTAAIITGGTFIGTGASGMAQTFSESQQGVISIRVGNQSAGTEIELKDKNGNIILSHSPELSFEIVILSSPDIVSGEEYTVTIGASSAQVTAD